MSSSLRKVRSLVVGVARSSFLSFVFNFESKKLVPLCFLLALISEVVALKHPLTGDTTIGVEKCSVGASAVAGICLLKGTTMILLQGGRRVYNR